MTTIYTFTDDINPLKLRGEIEASSIVGTIEAIHQKTAGPDNVSIMFASDLSAPDQTTLSGLITAHDPAPEPAIEGMVMVSLSFGNSDGTPLQGKTTQTKRLRSFIFQGTDFWGKAPILVEVSCYMEQSGKTGTIRLYDKTNDVVLGSTTITHTAEQPIEITCSGWSTGESLIELQAKTTNKQVAVSITAISILG